MTSHLWEQIAMAGHSTEIKSPYVQQNGWLAKVNQASVDIHRHLVEYRAIPCK